MLFEKLLDLVLFTWDEPASHVCPCKKDYQLLGLISIQYDWGGADGVYALYARRKN